MSVRKTDRMNPRTAPYDRPMPTGITGHGPLVPFFTDADLDFVLSGGSASDATPEISLEARALARTLAAQYVEVIAHYAVDALMGRTSRHAPKLKQVIKDSRRLAHEMGDGELLTMYDELGDLIDAFSATSTGEPRLIASRKLRDWVMGFADLVGDEPGQRLRRVVVFRKGVHPLISHLREVRGIGERRLERLYTAGLLTTESLIDAEPKELAGVVGIPLRLARAVVEACQRFVEQQRLTHVKSLKSVVVDVTKALKSVDPHDQSHVRLVAAVRDTINSLAEALKDLEDAWEQAPEA